MPAFTLRGAEMTPGERVGHWLLVRLIVYVVAALLSAVAFFLGASVYSAFSFRTTLSTPSSLPVERGPSIQTNPPIENASLHPATSNNMPSFITAPGETDVLMVVMVIVLLVAVVAFGVLFLRLHSLPERIAHKSQKIQFEIVAVLALISLFTHMHIFWIIGLLLALIDMPDFGNSLSRIAGSAERMAGFKPGEGRVDLTETTLADEYADESAASEIAAKPRGAESRDPSDELIGATFSDRRRDAG